MAVSAKELLKPRVQAAAVSDTPDIPDTELKNKRIAIRLTSSVYDDFTKILKIQEKQMSTVVTRWIVEYIKDNESLLQ